MNEDLEHRYAEIIGIARHDTELAFAQSEKLIAEYGDQARPWYARAYVNRHIKDFDAAIIDINRAIEIEPNQPRGYNTAAEIQIDAGKFSSAVDYLSTVIDREDMPYRDRFLSEALTFRAFAYINLRDFSAALDDLSIVELSGPIWLGKLYTKDDLVSECESGLRANRGGQGL